MKRARQRLVVVVVLVVLAGCGGKATTKAEPPPSCTASFACPEGQRCDAGTCVPDTACPAAVTPQLLFFDPIGSFYGYLVIRDGSPYWFDPEPDVDPGSIFDAVRARLVRLDTSETTFWIHPTGYGVCGNDFAFCRVYSGTPDSPETVWSGLVLDAPTGEWTAARVFPDAVPAGFDLLWWDFDTVIYSPTELRTFQVDTGVSEHVADLGGYGVSSVALRSDSPPLIALWESTEGTAAFATVEARANAPIVPIGIYNGPWHTMILAARIGDDWCLFHDDANRVTTVMKEVDGSFQLVGASDDPLLEAGVLTARSPEYRAGQTSVYAVACDGNSCFTGKVDFADASVLKLGSVSILGEDLVGVVGLRWLACGAADAIIKAHRSDGSEAFYSARISGSQ